MQGPGTKYILKLVEPFSVGICRKKSKERNENCDNGEKNYVGNKKREYERKAKKKLILLIR